jgi:hypothetical protein
MPRAVEAPSADAKTASAADWRDGVLQQERRAWQPTVTQSPDAAGPAADARDPEVTG